jgi:hypothetical protein
MRIMLIALLFLSGCGLEKDPNAVEAKTNNLPVGCVFSQVNNGNRVFNCPASCQITVDSQGNIAASSC